jgi:hypothetical protein
MLAENLLNGDMPVADWLALDRTDAWWSTCASPTSLPAGAFRMRSICGSRSCATATPSCR